MSEVVKHHCQRRPTVSNDRLQLLDSYRILMIYSSLLRRLRLISILYALFGKVLFIIVCLLLILVFLEY